MRIRPIGAVALAVLLCSAAAVRAQLPCGPFSIHQFAADAIPRIDGDASDWAEVSASETIGLDRLAADDGSGRHPDPASLSGRVKVGWVKGLNRLYFLYEAEDDYWDFDTDGLRNDIFELVVDGDRSGGPLIARFHPSLASRVGAAPGSGGLSDQEAWFQFQNIHAQNYHIFTPPGSKDIAMAWGPQAGWIKRLPWSNFASRHALRPGHGGKLTMEFWITPFDHADPEDPGKSRETDLVENNIVAMAWAVIDRDGAAGDRSAFWNLSPQHTMYGQASYLCAFRLMPRSAPALRADWSWRILNRDKRQVAFVDESEGPVTSVRWDFGDGTNSTERNPTHVYASPGKFVVTLEANGPSGRSRLQKVWDISFTGDPPK